ncbi:MAG: universal stress protein [Nitriliruptoraceae bacterium]
MMSQTHDGAVQRVLVGINASERSVHTLRRAAEEARARGATLEVLFTFPPRRPGTAFPVPPVRDEDSEDRERSRAQVIDRLRRWLDESGVDLDDLEVEWSVIADRRPARALVERSATADLVVVGAPGQGGSPQLSRGPSISDQVTRHAKAPVLVVRESTS